MAIDEGFGSEGDGGPGALHDCVGPDFPDRAVVGTSASPHFVRPPGALVHGIGVDFDSVEAAFRAERILGAADFARCLGASVSADLGAGFDAGTTTAEILGVDHEPTEAGHRVRFTGGDAGGLRPVHLEVACLRRDASVAVLWCGDTPGPFDPTEIRLLLHRLRNR